MINSDRSPDHPPPTTGATLAGTCVVVQIAEKAEVEGPGWSAQLAAQVVMTARCVH